MANHKFEKKIYAIKVLKKEAIIRRNEVKHIMAERNVPPGIYHGTNGGQTSWYELACKIFTLAGEDSNRVVAVNSSQNSRTAIRPDYSVLGHQKWLEAGITPMRDWQDSLSAVLPAILWDINQG